MDNTIYVVRWRRYYSEYDICYITRYLPQAEEVMKGKAERYPDLTFSIEEYQLDRHIMIWE